MGARRALLDPADVQGGRSEVDLIPAQVGQLARPQAMAIGDQDHRGVPVRPTVAFGPHEEPVDLGLGEVFSGPEVSVRAAGGSNCSFFGGWRDQLQV